MTNLSWKNIKWKWKLKSNGQPNVSSSRRKLEEIISDLRQEKDYLETKVGNLEKELAGSKESVHYQRIRALDLKHELREVGLSNQGP